MDIKEWLRNVPSNIKNELESLDMCIGGIMGREEAPYAIVTSVIPIKGNKELINKILSMGYVKDREYVADGVRYIKFKKYL